MITDTIVAQCTPSGSGALALIRVSGPHSSEIVAQCSRLSSSKKLTDTLSHTIHHGWIVGNESEIIDEVMFFVMHAPRTFTGENVVEITTHNNPFIVNSVIEKLITCGARLAQPGEFSRQAVMNNKLDLVQAEAINDVVHAHSQYALKLSLQQLKGSFSEWINILEKDLLKLRALCEATFEFLEEEIDFNDQIKNELYSLVSKISLVKNSFDQQQRLREGIRVALVGSVNAGKSSLFNRLLKKDRSIVTNIAGTTRDVIEGGRYKDGMYWTFIDTAGLRKTEDIVEKEGIERAYQETEQADIVLLIFDGSAHLSTEEEAIYRSLFEKFNAKIIPVTTKSDLVCHSNSVCKNTILISSKTTAGIEQLEETINEKIASIFKHHTSSFLLNNRHFTLLISLEKELFLVSDLFKNQIEYELVSYHLKRCLEILGEITGKTVDEKMLDTIFKDFCIGK